MKLEEKHFNKTVRTSNEVYIFEKAHFSSCAGRDLNKYDRKSARRINSRVASRHGLQAEILRPDRKRSSKQ